MKIIGILFTILTAFLGCSDSSKWETNSKEREDRNRDLSPYEQQVLNYRDSMSAIFYSGSNNVLPEDEISPMGKLIFFDVDEKFRIKATFKKIEDGEVFEMKTSTDRLPEYRVYGKFSFQLDGDQSLTLYQNVEQPEYLFCPFKDVTNGETSYGAGRYLDFKMDDLASPILDFNYAYNPYCAYNKKYSCPIPPYENHLKVPVIAGEKKWH
ncbi:MAG: hypothetical protein COA58_05395 [Bacteroidetes bacterium]|nr:MAG: hypothetical protein COA58_05395 [Bacteroidota bacterium]